MASLIDYDDGKKRIEFVTATGRKRIKLGEVDRKTAAAFQLRVEKLIELRALNGIADSEMTQWLNQLPDKRYEQLARNGLVKARQFLTVPLAFFIDTYIEDRTDIKPMTKIGMKSARRELVEFFGSAKELKAVKPPISTSRRR